MVYRLDVDAFIDKETGIASDKEGLPISGVVKEYFDIGKIKWETPYKDGKKEGTGRWYYESGKIKYEMPYKDGKKEGICKYYSESGRIQYEFHYKDGEMVTEKGEKIKKEEETPIKEYRIKDGDMQTVFIDMKTDIATDRYYELISGVVTEYFNSGSLKIETPYKDGKREGTQREYYESGKIMWETPYKDGKKEGTEIWYSESGKIMWETPYKEDKREGTQREYYERGRLKSKTEYKDDERIGITRYSEF
jgi:antitoxin component YwqK of YwqJK toxin-antitoxin module